MVRVARISARIGASSSMIRILATFIPLFSGGERFSRFPFRPRRALTEGPPPNDRGDMGRRGSGPSETGRRFAHDGDDSSGSDEGGFTPVTSGLQMGEVGSSRAAVRRPERIRSGGEAT